MEAGQVKPKMEQERPAAVTRPGEVEVDTQQFASCIPLSSQQKARERPTEVGGLSLTVNFFRLMLQYFMMMNFHLCLLQQVSLFVSLV